MKNNGLYRITNSNESTIGDVVSDLWNAISGDKILTGMGLVTILTIVGTVLDCNYSLDVNKERINLHPEDK